MDTQCKECVFAEWNGNTQIQCEFDRLEKFAENGTEVVEEIDGEKSSFRILGRVCNTCRHPSTLEGVPARKWREHVRQEITVRVCMGVYVDGDDFIRATRTLKSILAQSVKPDSILVIYNRDGQKAHPDYQIWMDSFVEGIPWRIESMKVPVEYGDAIDLAVASKDMKSTYFVVAKAGYEYSPKYIEVVDRAINDDLKRFVALLPDEDGNGLFVQVGLHNLVQGNKKMHGCNDIIDKLRSIADEEGTLHMIKRYGDLS